MSAWRQITILLLAATGGGLQASVDSWPLAAAVGFPFFLIALVLWKRWQEAGMLDPGPDPTPVERDEGWDF